MLAVSVLLAGLYALGALLPFWYLTSPEAGAAFFPPAGITLAVLVMTPRRTWPLWLVIIAVTEVAVDLTHGQTVGMALGFAAANVIEPLIGASLLRSAMRGAIALRQMLPVYVLCAVVVGPAAGAAVGASTAVLIGGSGDWWGTAARWWLGDALGVLVIATPIFAWSRWSRFDEDYSTLEAALTTVFAAAITVVPALIWGHPMLYGVLPVLTFAAFRGGARGVSIAGVGVAFAADWAAVTGRAGELIAGGTPAEQLAYVQLFIGVTLLVALVLANEVIERRRAEVAGRRAQAQQAQAELAATAAAGVERRRIARETHDIVSHALNVILLQAGAARRMLNTDVDESRVLLEAIEKIGRGAFRDLDVALGLADDPPDQFSGRGLASVPSLVALMRQSGMIVDLTVEGDGNGSIPTIVDWSAFRIIQEAMTNVVKYAPGAHTHVTVRFLPDEIVVSVVDDGAGKTPLPPTNGSGRGLIGMRERVTALGGHIDIGANGGPGFAVRASLPVPAPS
jgi:signal transduction histidine kinase